MKQLVLIATMCAMMFASCTKQSKKDITAFEINLPEGTTELPQTVSDAVMTQVYEEVKTPFKYGLIMADENFDIKYDCPTIFRKDSLWFMVYIAFDGRGYETHLASSKNLLHWEKQGTLMAFSDTTDWDSNQKAGYINLIDYDWGGEYGVSTAKDGNYWMSYFGGNTRGYEAGVLSFGMAHTNQCPTQAHEWNRLPEPVMTPHDADARWYDNSTMYKTMVYKDEKRLTGHDYVMYYNARGDSINPARGAERIAMAVSDDMKTWTRLGSEPVLNHHKGITGDAVLQRMGDLYVMFYFRAYWPEGETVVYNSFACSYDLVNWTQWQGEHLIEPSEDYDNWFAHKAFVIKSDGVVYQFYNAVNKDGARGIAVATSKDLGRSEMRFAAKAE
ncbi:MAG: hypothetical protein ACK5IJ_11025 [Mangrovibacterium sp.]